MSSLREPLEPAVCGFHPLVHCVLRHQDRYSGQWVRYLHVWVLGSGPIGANSNNQQRCSPRITLLLTKWNAEHTANTHKRRACVPEYMSSAPGNRKSSQWRSLNVISTRELNLLFTHIAQHWWIVIHPHALVCSGHLCYVSRRVIAPTIMVLWNDLDLIVLFSVWDVAPESKAATQTSSMLTYPQSTCVSLLFLQESTMASTAVRDAKASLRGPSVRILPTHVETTKSAWLTSARGTAANTAAIRSASPWAWSGKVCVQDVRLLYWLDFILL